MHYLFGHGQFNLETYGKAPAHCRVYDKTIAFIERSKACSFNFNSVTFQSLKNFTSKSIFIILYIFYFVGRKGEKGETSEEEISNVKESILDLQENINETLSNTNKKRYNS